MRYNLSQKLFLAEYRGMVLTITHSSELHPLENLWKCLVLLDFLQHIFQASPTNTHTDSIFTTQVHTCWALQANFSSLSLPHSLDKQEEETFLACLLQNIANNLYLIQSQRAVCH